MNKLILHVGPHKTGSTYLQKMFLENINTLRDFGVYYPEKFWMFFGQHGLAFDLMKGNLGVKFNTQIEEIRALNGDVILSSENFSRLNQKHFKTIKKAFKGYDVSVIYYLREPSARLLSLWQTEVKHGEMACYFEYAYEHISRPFASSILNQTPLLECLRNVFGSSALKIINYETSCKTDALLGDFMAAAGLQDSISGREASINPMSNLAEVEIVRCMNIRANLEKLLKGRNVQNAFMESYPILRDEIDTLKSVISAGSKEVVVNGTLFDKLMIKNVQDAFSAEFTNERIKIEKKTMQVPNSSWLSREDTYALLDQIYHEVVKVLK